MSELSQFVRDALAMGKNRAEIQAVLAEAGWKADEIADGLSSFADVDFPVPVPRRRTSSSAREAFLYVVTFAMLYTAAISLGNLLCGFVDTFLPDVLEAANSYGNSYRREGLRWLVASLVVSFPVWLLLTKQHLISYEKDPERRASPVRGWLTYLTLVIAALTALVTLMVLLAGALGGDFVVQTLIKSAIVLSISGGIFKFYLWELRRGEGKVDQ